MAKEFMPLNKPKTVADMRKESSQRKADVANKKTPISMPGLAGAKPITNERPATGNVPKPPIANKMVPKGGKASMAADTEKPVTNTSGTATEKKGSKWFESMKKSVQFGARYAGTAGALAAVLGTSVRKVSRDNPTGTPMYINPSKGTVLPAGTVIPSSPKPTKTEKPPTDTGGSGIDAPAPDTGWRPSGTNSASGLQQKTMGIALQEQIGVTKRKR